MNDISKDYECTSSLDMQRSQWLVVLGKDYLKNDFDTNITRLSRHGFTYYAILHDNDKDERGVLKYAHYHIVLTTNKRPRAKSIINLMCDIFGCKAENVSVDECIDLTLSIQYLIHKNDFMKYQYDINNILTNDCFNDIGDIMAVKAVKMIVSTESLTRIISGSRSRLDIINALGVSSYAYYRHTIDDIIHILGRYDLLPRMNYANPTIPGFCK